MNESCALAVYGCTQHMRRRFLLRARASGEPASPVPAAPPVLPAKTGLSGWLPSFLFGPPAPVPA